MKKEETFLPEGYEPPKATSKYLTPSKIEDGKTARFRIMSSPILGWEYWDKQTKDHKPVRLPYTEASLAVAQEEASKNKEQDDQRVNHFWIMIVWNYDTKNLEVCEITQKTILSTMRNLLADEEYGSPKNYDLKITKKKEKDKTTYEVTPGVPKEAPEEAIKEHGKGLINLRALFYGADPFDTKWVEEFADGE